VIGERHLRCFLEREFGVHPGSYRYHKRAAQHIDGQPYVLELAFGVRDTGSRRVLLNGVNWSPVEVGALHALPNLVGEARGDRHDPIVLVTHLAVPQPGYGDRAKSQVTLL
jgi:hypothetical protein